MIYPALLGGFLSISITLLFRRLHLSGVYWQYLGVVPLADMLLDYFENTLILLLLVNYPAQLPMAATADGFVTFFKNVSGMPGFIAFGMGLALLFMQRFKKKVV